MAPIDDFESEEYDDDKPNNDDFSEDEDFFDDLEKKDKSWRPVSDFRALNKQLEDVYFPIPFITLTC